VNRVGYGTRAVGQFCFLLHPLEHNRCPGGRGLGGLSLVIVRRFISIRSAS